MTNLADCKYVQLITSSGERYTPEEVEAKVKQITECFEGIKPVILEAGQRIIDFIKTWHEGLPPETRAYLDSLKPKE